MPPEQAQNPPAQVPAPTPPPAGSQGEDTAGLKSALDAERTARKAEAQRAREADKQLQELLAWKQEQEDKGKSESERLTVEAQRAKDAAAKASADADAAIARANERVIRAEVKVLAQAAGFADPDDAWALMDRAAVTLDDAGDVTGADAAITALAEKKPHLLRREGGDSGNYGAPSGGRASGPGDANAMRRAHEEAAATSGRYIPF